MAEKNSKKYVNEVLKELGYILISDYEGTKKAVLDLYQKYKSNQLSISSSSIDKYSRENCAKHYASLLNEISK